MNVVIVGRTRMQSGLCIGGMTTDYRSVRVLPPQGHAHPEDAPYQVGDIWELDLHPIPHVQGPHVEDMVLRAPGRRIDRLEDVGEWVMRGVQPWRGPAAIIFDGTIRASAAGRAHVGSDAVPTSSVGFWMPDRPLVLSEGDRLRYTYTDHEGGRWRFTYAGTAPALRIIPAWMLVRVSLARWWAPADGSIPAACYAQVSGWFPVEASAEGLQATPERHFASTRA